MPLPDPQSLRCCCCGESTVGRQWSNRDTGYGLCVPCADWLPTRGTTDAEMHELYGIRGVHYAIVAEPPFSPIDLPSADTPAPTSL